MRHHWTYTTENIKKHGITSNMLLYVCKKVNISLLGYDDYNKMFVRFTPDRTKHKYKSIVFQMALQHFYIITNTDIINSLTASISNTCFKDLAIEYGKKSSFYYFITDINEWLENPKSFIFDIYKKENLIIKTKEEDLKKSRDFLGEEETEKPITSKGQNKIIITNTDLMFVVQKLIINKIIPKLNMRS